MHDPNQPLPSCILYKNWSNENREDFRVGFDALPNNNQVGKTDIYIPNIKARIIEFLESESKSRCDIIGPNIETVVADFLKAIYKIFENFLRGMKEYEPNNKETRNMDSCRYCFAVPDGFAYATEYTKLIRTAFIAAGFLNPYDKEEKQDRLLFVNDAVAAGYDVLLLSRKESGIKDKCNYMLCDIGYYSIKYSIIKAKSTNAMSSVMSLCSNGLPGYSNLNKRFKKSSKQNLAVVNTERNCRVIESLEEGGEGGEVSMS